MDSLDNGIGGTADASAADASFGGSVEGLAGGGGADFGASGFGSGNDSGGGGSGLGGFGGFGTNGGAVVDLSGSSPGANAGAFAAGVAGTIAGLGVLAMGNPFGVVVALTNAGMSYGQAVAATRDAIGFAYDTQNQAIANNQLSAFTQ
jgi:hypothetical protein